MNRIANIISSIYSIETMNTTIALSVEMKEKIRSLGKSGESYDAIIRRMYEVANHNVLAQFLYDTSNSVSIDEAIAEAEKRWPASKSR